MKVNRREFLILTATCVAGCRSVEDIDVVSTGKERVVNAGPVSDYNADGVYSAFRNQGFFVVRRGEKLFVLSAICTHKRCKLDAERDGSFYCPCHGSTFDPTGSVTEGPARRDLPIFATSVDENGQLLVTIPTAR